MSQLKITFLGTSGSMPTPQRGSSSVVMRRGRKLIMFDCGEGTQRQMTRAHIGFQRPMKILISHMHGDHVLGLPGMLQSMSLLGREKPLHIYGPVGLVDYVKAFSESLGGPGFPVILYEIQEQGIIYDSVFYHILAIKAIHRSTAWSYVFIEKPRPGRFYPDKARALGVPEGELWGRLQRGESVTYNGETIHSDQVTGPIRPGRKIVYSGDTAPNPELVKVSRNADLLIHEATFMEELEDRAEEDGHTTAAQAAKLAREADVDKLVLTHISSRYPDPEMVRNEAQEYFDNVIIAEDLMEIDVSLK